MRFELFIALRYLSAKRKQAFISVISIISILGVGLGVAALIVAMGVMNGFTTTFRDKVLAANSEILVYNRIEPIRDPVALRQKLLAAPGVRGVTPFIYTELMLSASGGVKGVMLRGIDPETAPDVITILKDLHDGKIEYMTKVPEDAPDYGPGITVGKELAKTYDIKVGDRVNLLAPTGQRGTAGFTPRIRSFRVAGIFVTGMYEYDITLAFTTLEGAREVAGIPDGRVTGMEMTTGDIFTADKTAAEVQAVLGGNYSVKSWMETNSNIFAALKLEKLAMGVVLMLLVMVASFTIIATLVMLVMDKTKDIAVLMSMGATRETIRRIFTWQGMIIGLIGTMLGFVIGLTLCFLLARYRFIKLPPGVYPVDYVPVLLNGIDLGIIAAGAMIICRLATIYPSRQAASLVPAEALHYE